MMEQSLIGKHALVTGGGTGIGAAIALKLQQAGAKVTISGRREQVLNDFVRDNFNPDLHPIYPIVADITLEDEVNSLFNQARAKHGSVDILIANAGAANSAPFLKTSLAMWNELMAVNLTGSFLCAQAALKDMAANKQGRVIFIASIAGHKGYSYVAPYCAAKHGVIGLMKALSVEFISKNITVNAICPGYVDTPMLAQSIHKIINQTGLPQNEASHALSSQNPHGKFIQPDEIAAMALFLCQKEAASINGQSLIIAGGDV